MMIDARLKRTFRRSIRDHPRRRSRDQIARNRTSGFIQRQFHVTVTNERRIPASLSLSGRYGVSISEGTDTASQVGRWAAVHVVGRPDLEIDRVLARLVCPRITLQC